MHNTAPEPLRTTPGTHRYVGPHREVGWVPATVATDGVVDASGDIVLTLDDYRALRAIQRLSSPPHREAKLGCFVDSDVLGRRAAWSGHVENTEYNAIDVLHTLIQEYFLPSIAGLDEDALRSELQAALESELESAGDVDYTLRLDAQRVDQCIYETDYADRFPAFRNLSPTFRVRHGETLAETNDPRTYITKVRAAVGELLDARFPGQVVAADEGDLGSRLDRAVLISVPASSDAPLFEVAGRLFHELEVTADSSDFVTWDDSHTVIEYVSGGEVLGDGQLGGFRGIRLYAACTPAVRF